MRPAQPNTDDDTIRIVRRPRHKRAAVAASLVAVAVLLGGTAAWWFWPHSAPPHPVPTASIPAPPVVATPLPPAASPAPPATAPAPATPPAFEIRSAAETQIRNDIPTDLTVFRFADNPNIIVLDFASLHEQGKMLNRMAALMEKANLPRDRVLTDQELDAAILKRGDTVETFYYGHDYPAEALVRFFALADAQHIQLDPQEERLRALLQQIGWSGPNAVGGLISLPAAGSAPNVTVAARTSILRHELSHGEFFSDPDYAAYVHNFWLTKLTEAERANVRKFLATEDYDVTDEVLMYNEMQAYLMFTRDPQFFRPELVGLTPERLADIQARFLAGMRPGWLRDVLASYQPSATAQ
jgi:hypothetical protein